MTATLLASVIVSFTFMPLIAYYLIKPPAHASPPMAERRTHGFAGFYYRVGDFAAPPLGRPRRLARHPGCRVDVHVEAQSAVLPQDLSYLSYVDVWPPDAPLGATNAAAANARARHPGESARFGKEHHVDTVLKTLTTFRWRRPALLVLGGSGAAPAQLRADHRRGHRQALDEQLVGPLQTALSRDVPGARIDVGNSRQASPWASRFRSASRGRR